MIYELATIKDLQTVYDVVQHTIKTIYPKYYPTEVVDFFCEHHNKDAILKDIENGDVSVLKVDEKIIGTGSAVYLKLGYLYPCVSLHSSCYVVGLVGKGFKSGSD